MNALHVVISMNLKLKEGRNHLLILNAFIDDDSNLDIELGTFARNVKKEVCGVIDFFLAFLKKYDARRIHNILSLMLNLKFKILKLISCFIGHEQGMDIAEKYDRRSLFLMLLKSLSSFASIIQD